ncbi:MAG: ferrous iron transport protein A [Anaerolineae bacterium]|nr:ferrous iron transport protein A [Anaerolineae bacterium]
MLKRLSELSPGESGTIRKVEGDKAIRRRMLDMGLVNGAEVHVKRVAPLGDPIEFIVRGYSLSLRKAEALAVHVETA